MCGAVVWCSLWCSQAGPEISEMPQRSKLELHGKVFQEPASVEWLKTTNNGAIHLINFENGFIYIYKMIQRYPKWVVVLFHAFWDVLGWVETTTPFLVTPCQEHLCWMTFPPPRWNVTRQKRLAAITRLLSGLTRKSRRVVAVAKKLWPFMLARWGNAGEGEQYKE